MPTYRFAVAILIAAVLGSFASSAAAAPPFPRNYRGTITGTQIQPGIKASWTIKGVVLHLVKVRKSDADWSAIYEVKGGKVSYHEAETGDCSYTLDVSLPLRGSLSKISAPFALSQSLFFNHKTTALGLMDVTKSFKATETCQQPDGEPAQQSSRKIHLPTLFDPGERVLKLGKRFAAKNSASDDYTHSKTKWSWVLKP